MMPSGLVAALVSWAVCLSIIRYGRTHARRYRSDAPQRFHLGSVPRLGALGMVCGFFAALATVPIFLGDASRIDGSLPLVALCALMPMVAGGVVEDLTQRLTVLNRLFLTAASSALAIGWLDLSVPRLGVSYWGGGWATVPALGWLLSWVSIAGLPHAFNLIDGYNGLAGSVALAVCLALTYVASQVGDTELMYVSLVLVGSTLGFLFWNYPRGLIFAGDGGAYLWGGVIAIASITLVQRHTEVSPWFPMLLLIYPVWETVFSIYRKAARGTSPGMADSLHFHQLIYRRIVREVFHDDEARRMLMRNNRTSPYLGGFTLLTVIPAVLFWRNTPVLMGFCLLFVCTYVPAYLMIVRFKVPHWIRRGRKR